MGLRSFRGTSARRRWWGVAKNAVRFHLGLGASCPVKEAQAWAILRRRSFSLVGRRVRRRAGRAETRSLPIGASLRGRSANAMRCPNLIPTIFLRQSALAGCASLGPWSGNTKQDLPRRPAHDAREVAAKAADSENEPSCRTSAVRPWIDQFGSPARIVRRGASPLGGTGGP